MVGVIEVVNVRIMPEDQFRLQSYKKNLTYANYRARILLINAVFQYLALFHTLCRAHIYAFCMHRLNHFVYVRMSHQAYM